MWLKNDENEADLSSSGLFIELLLVLFGSVDWFGLEMCRQRNESGLSHNEAPEKGTTGLR